MSFLEEEKNIKVSLKSVSDYLTSTSLHKEPGLLLNEGKAAASDSLKLTDPPRRSPALRPVPLSTEAPLLGAGNPASGCRQRYGRAVGQGGAQAPRCQAGGSGSK